MKPVRIGNGCGFWGDNLDAPVILAERGRLGLESALKDLRARVAGLEERLRRG